MSKIYIDVDVYEAAKKRISVIFNDFERICVSYSGGKDSAVMLNLCLDYMKENEIKRKIGVLVIDLEGNYEKTEQHITKMVASNRDRIELYWVCLPLNLRNSVSVYNPFWCCWDPDEKENWIRPMPTHDRVISDYNFFPFFKFRMEFEEFVLEFAKWYSEGKMTASLVGIRTDESLNRFRAIVSESKATHNEYPWTTLVDDQIYNCYPIYDWRTEDIWAANGKFEWEYNKLYDMFYLAGVGIHSQRICQPYGDDQRIGLELFRVVEPETWCRVVNRVSGANYGNIYCGTKMIGYRKVSLPDGHTWKSYTKLLLSSLPDETRANYTDKFVKFIRYWRKNGSAVADDYLAMLPEEAEITGRMSTRGGKNKVLVQYKKIPDHLNNEIESKRIAPTWRRMATCILKNDHLCKGLSFTQTKKQIKRRDELIARYKNL